VAKDRYHRKRPDHANRQNSSFRASLWTLNYQQGLVILVFFVAAFLRLYQLPSVPAGLNHDEGMNGSNALENIETHQVRIFYTENTGREGLFINVQTAFVALMGNTALALRLPSALFGLLTILGIYRLAGQMFNKPIGLAAAFFTATSFWHLIFSRTGLRAISAPCFLVWAIYGFQVGIRRARAGRPYLATMLLAGAVYGLGFHTYIAYRIMPALMLVTVAAPLWVARDENWIARYWRASGAFCFAAVLAAAPLAFYFLKNPGTFSERTAHLSVMATSQPLQELLSNTAKTVWMFFGEGDGNGLHNYPGRPELIWPVAAFFALGTGRAFVTVAKNLGTFTHPDVGWEGIYGYALLLVWMAVGGLPAILAHDRMPHSLRTILMIPPTFVLAAAGAHQAWLYVWPRWPRPLTFGLAAALALFLCVEPYHEYFDVWSPNPNTAKYEESESVEFARRINSLPANIPKYVAVSVQGGLEKGVPIQAQTIMYLTRSYTELEQRKINIRYVSPWNFRPTGERVTPGMDFCHAVAATLSEGSVLFCLE
jgi:4-amino-4-deoxy-L-arabinose transferase-like glycosyltransferase